MERDRTPISITTAAAVIMLYVASEEGETHNDRQKKNQTREKFEKNIFLYIYIIRSHEFVVWKFISLSELLFWRIISFLFFFSVFYRKIVTLQFLCSSFSPCLVIEQKIELLITFKEKAKYHFVCQANASYSDDREWHIVVNWWEVSG